jgi:hypothetical protein
MLPLTEGPQSAGRDEAQKFAITKVRYLYLIFTRRTPLYTIAIDLCPPSVPHGSVAYRLLLRIAGPYQNSNHGIGSIATEIKPSRLVAQSVPSLPYTIHPLLSVLLGNDRDGKTYTATQIAEMQLRTSTEESHSQR